MMFRYWTHMQCFLLFMVCILQNGCNAEVSTSSPPSQANANASHGRICTGVAGEVQGMNCIPANLAPENQRACRGEGQDRDAKDLSQPCCPGLRAISSAQPLANGRCESSAPPSVQVCTRCGDNVCGVGENTCNCAQDCHSH